MDPALAAAMRRFHRIVDEQARVLEDSDARFVCPVPCARCCTPNLFFITGLDFLALCEHVNRSLAREEIEGIVMRSRQLVAECGIEEALRLDTGQADAEPRVVQACPLLDGAERCLAYPARPTPCRFFGRSRFAAGQANLCTILADRLAEDLGRIAMPVVEDYSRALASCLARELGDRLDDIAPYAGVSTLPVFIARTGFREDLVLGVCFALPSS